MRQLTHPAQSIRVSNINLATTNGFFHIVFEVNGEEVRKEGERVDGMPSFSQFVEYNFNGKIKRNCVANIGMGDGCISHCTELT